MPAAPATPPRPLIGINTDFYTAGKTYPAHARLNAGYFDAVLQAGGLPLLIPPLNKEAELEALLAKVDGIVLTGGLDMDPRKMGAPLTATTQPMAERRDSSDRILIQKVIQKRTPVLAIGVGMQQLNVLMGGTLFQHLPLDCPKSFPHFDPTGGPHRHMVNIVSDSRLEEIYGALELRVNSRHHQAVDMVAPKLKVAARSPDEVIEAVEAEDADWFCVGVQWRPEADTATALDMQIFECFVQACIRASAPATTTSKGKLSKAA